VSDLGLSTLASALQADTALLDTASNNLANINTPGYAQEAVNLSPESAAGPYQVGQGVSITSVQALVDAVYASTNVVAQGAQGSATQTSQILTSIEGIFPEPSSSGLGGQLAQLWSDIGNLATNPGQSGAQQAVAVDAQHLASSLNASSTQLTQLASSLQAQVGTGAADGGQLSEVNSLLAQVATLNQGIVAGAAAGQDVNALGDQRRAAVDTLATLVGSTTSTQPDGSLTVRIGGIQLVSGDNALTLATSGSSAGADLAVVTGSGTTIGVGGSIGANIAAIDTTIAGYQSQLSAVADSLAGNVNSLQANGLDAAGDPGQAIAGSWAGTVLPDIFVTTGSSTYTPGGNSAATIAVSAAYAADPSLIATAAAPGAGNANVIGTATLDGTNAQTMAALASATDGPDAIYRGLIGNLGSDAANATTAASTATNMASTAAANVAAASGVNQNQEEIDVLSAQNAFQAASKAISAVTASFQSLLQAV